MRQKVISSLSVGDITGDFDLPFQDTQTCGIRTQCIQPSNSYNIFQWNCRSVHSEAKANFIRSAQADIFALQEIWQRSNNIINIGEVLNIPERKDYRGGGTATLCHSSITIQTLRVFLINKDTTAMKLKISNQYLWLVNTYLHKGSKNQIQKLFGKLRKEIPVNE